MPSPCPVLLQERIPSIKALPTSNLNVYLFIYFFLNVSPPKESIFLTTMMFIYLNNLLNILIIFK